MNDVEESCGNCRFYKPGTGSYKTKGDCNRNPPTIIVQVAEVGFNISSSHPPVLSSDWCGEWHYKNAPK